MCSNLAVMGLGGWKLNLTMNGKAWPLEWVPHD